MNATKTGLRIQKPAAPLPQDETRIKRLWSFALIRCAVEHRTLDSPEVQAELKKEKERLKNEAESHLKWKMAEVSPAYEKLKKRVEKFESDSGMKLEDWRLGNVGDLARRLHALNEEGYDGFTTTLKRQLIELESLKSRVAEVLEAIGKPALSGTDSD